MTKGEFLKEQKYINNQISELKDRFKKLESKYIEYNKKFSVGDKVKVTQKIGMNIGNVRYAFVNNIRIIGNGDLDYCYSKCKKDGNPSKQSEYINMYRNNIEKVESNKN